MLCWHDPTPLGHKSGAPNWWRHAGAFPKRHHLHHTDAASTPRRKNKPHSEGHSRSEWLADHGPLERLGEGAVEVGDEGFDARLQVLLRGEAGAAQQLAHEDGEPDLDLVQPGRMLGGEVKADAVAGIAQERLTTGH